MAGSKAVAAGNALIDKIRDWVSARTTPVRREPECLGSSDGKIAQETWIFARLGR